MKKSVKTLVMMAVFVCLMSIAAYIKIPTPLVPVTFQLFVAVASGLFLGPVFGPISMAVYMIAGLIGLPVFAGGGGIMYFLTPSFGFIIGFILCSYISGVLWTNAWPRRILAIILSVISSYIVGIPYFWLIMNAKKPQEFGAAVLVMLPFLAKDIVLGGVLFGFAQTMSKIAPELIWRNRKSLT